MKDITNINAKATGSAKAQNKAAGTAKKVKFAPEALAYLDKKPDKEFDGDQSSYVPSDIPAPTSKTTVAAYNPEIRDIINVVPYRSLHPRTEKAVSKATAKSKRLSSAKQTTKPSSKAKTNAALDRVM